MKNILILEFRERYKVLNKDRELIVTYLENTHLIMDDFYKKYFRLEKVKQLMNLFITRNEIDKIKVKDVFYFSADGTKFYPLESQRKTKENLEKILNEINDEMNYYREMTIRYCEIIQLHIDKLQLIEDTYFNLMYAIDYLELGQNSIEVNNNMDYTFYFKIYYNTFAGYESSKKRLAPVKIKEVDVLKFIQDQKEPFL